MTDKEAFLAHWTPTIGQKEAEKSWAMKDVKRQANMVMSDIQPYKSMIDGSWITSRSRHRTHLKDHGCIEVGNEKQEHKPKQYYDPKLKAKIGEIVYSKLKY